MAFVPGNVAIRWIAGGDGEANPTLAILLPRLRLILTSRRFGCPSLLFVDESCFASIGERIERRHTIYRPAEVSPATTGMSAGSWR